MQADCLINHEEHGPLQECGSDCRGHEVFTLVFLRELHVPFGYAQDRLRCFMPQVHAYGGRTCVDTQAYGEQIQDPIDSFIT
jgi:hypothetical protein